MEEELEFRNILIIYNNEFYKEFDLDEFKEELILIGNTKDSNIKLNVDKSKDILIKFIKRNDSWQLSGAENTYCVINGVKVPRKNISNGDKIIIKDIETKEEIFKINYFIDFIVEDEDYNREVSFRKTKKIKIGSNSNNNIIIDSIAVDKNHAEIINKNFKYFLKDLDSKFGTYLNGKQVSGKVEIGDNDFIIISGYKFLFKDGKVFMSKTDKIKINGVEEKIKPINALLTYPCFYRSPRLLKDVPEDDVVIDEPPGKMKQESSNLITTMIPLLGTAALTISVSANKEDKSSLVLTIGMAALTGFVALLTFAMQMYDTKKNQFIRYKRYKAYVKEKEQQIVAKRELLIKSIRNNNPNTEDCISFLNNFNRRLWERTPLHKDFLNISLGRGTGDLTFDIKVQEKKVEVDTDKLKEDPRKLKDIYGKMEDVPICINLTKEFPVGVYGKKSDTIELIKNLVIKISTFHYYEDVKIAAIFSKKDESDWEWLKWIPHTWSKDKTFRYIGDTKESAHNVLNELYDEIKLRGNSDEERTEKKLYVPYYIIIIADRLLIENEPLMEIIESNKECGATGIFVYEDLGLIPKDSKKIINVTENKSAEYIDVLNSNNVKKVSFNPIKDEVCDFFARNMSPIYVKTSFTQSALTSYFTLFDLYNIKDEKELPIISNWNRNKVYKSMEVPLGVRAGNEVVYLNLHEKFHGPHGLVAGTTGSGKSEILQTYIASLAINYHPYDISIIIIDYKGGGMANQFKNLPHLVGTITNLDGNQINRALISIKSELKRRQRIFSEYNVNHIDSYIKLFKEGKAKEPLPHLIMIADEFAELKHDQPDFMTELVSAARIGRSLGVHLILATQKPAGVVDDQIWSNSKFKLCLKVQDADDSNEMIKTPLAANIVEAGRAYFQVGNNEIFELFQSAWSGAKKYSNDDVNKKEIEISEVLIDGRRKEIYSTKNDEQEKESETQLDAIINRINDVAEENSIKRLNGPWLPALEEVIYLNDIDSEFDIESWKQTKTYLKAVVGVYDDPEKQVQDKLELNFTEDGNMFLIGSPGTGKTTMVQTLVTSILENYTSDLVNIYILDFGTRILKVYENAPQVGGVITSDDEDLLANFLKLINKESKRRKSILSENGVSNIISYREVTGNILPHILIIIDNFAAFIELYEDYEDDITKISRDGANLGITLIITASNSSDIRYKISSNCKINLTLNCVDNTEYSSILGRISLEPAKNEGRGLVKLNNICEYQTALPIKGYTEGERSKNIQKLIEVMNNNCNEPRAKRIPIFTEALSLDDFINSCGEQNTLSNLYFAIDVNEFENVNINIEENSFIPVVGKPLIGKSNLLMTLGRLITETNGDYKIYVIDSEGYGLYDFQNYSNINFYSNDKEEIIECLNELKTIIDDRKYEIDDLIMESKGKVRDRELLEGYERVIIIIDDMDELLNNIQDEYDALELFDIILSKKSGYGFTVIAAGEEGKFNDQSYNHNFMDLVKKNNFGILLNDLEEQDYFNFKISYSVKEKRIIPGDGYIINKGQYSRIKIPKH